MNPNTVMKISSKVDVAKITYTVGGVMLLIIMFLYIKKKIKESRWAPLIFNIVREIRTVYSLWTLGIID